MANNHSVNEPRVTLKLSATFDRTEQYITFDWHPEYNGPRYRDDKDKCINKIFGRMNYQEYPDKLFPFFPAFLQFSKASNNTHGNRTEFTESHSDIVVAVDPDKVKASLLKSLQKSLTVNSNHVKDALIKELAESENVSSELVKTSIDFTAEDATNAISAIDQLLEEFRTKLVDVLGDKKIGVNLKKKIRTTQRTPVLVPQSIYLFSDVNNFDVQIVCSEQLAIALAMLQPYLDYCRDTLDLIKKWRVGGIPAEMRTYEYKGEAESIYDHQWTSWAIGCRLKSF